MALSLDLNMDPLPGEVMRTKTSTIIDCKYNFGPGGRGLCRLRAWEPGPDRPSVVVLSELPSTHPSITEFPEILARDICDGLGLNPECVLWVEHLLDCPISPEQCFAVSFDRDPSGRLCRPVRRQITWPSVAFTISAPRSR